MFASTCGEHEHTTLILCNVDEKWCLCTTVTDLYGALSALVFAARILDSKRQESKENEKLNKNEDENKNQNKRNFEKKF